MLALAAFVLPSAGCFEAFKKKPYAESTTAEAKKKREDGNEDVSFQAFAGRLRAAVANRDLGLIASMMTPDFGYRWDEPPPGDNVFAYWDATGTWRELELVLKEKFVPFDGYMVAPPQVAHEPGYSGYRAGIAKVGGSWRFAYFVPAPVE